MGTIFFYGNKEKNEKYFPELEEINEETDEDDE